MTLLPQNVKLKTLVSFPSNAYGGTGIKVVKENGNFTIDMDYSEFAFSGTVPPNTSTLVWDSVSNTYTLVPPSSVGGITDAPSDNIIYGRRNTAWAPISASILVAATAPPSPPDSSLWWNSSSGNLYVRYNDGNSVQWVLAVPVGSDINSLGGVAYTTQTATSAQKTIARQNIAAAPFDALSYNGAQVNGSCEIDQPNNGAVLSFPGSPSSNTQHLIDGWGCAKSGACGFTIQQVGSIFRGYNRELKVIVNAADTASTIQLFNTIEGYRFVKAGWGTTAAQPVSVGFWVKSSVAGVLPLVMFDGVSAGSSAYTNITAANTLQFVTATFAPPPSWAASITNGLGASFTIYLSGGPSGINIAASNGNTIEITGLVILPGVEMPSAVAAPFIMRPYDTELTLCKRYWEKNAGNYRDVLGSSGIIWTSVQFTVEKRSAPGMSYISDGTKTNSNFLGFQSNIFSSLIQFNGTAGSESYNFGYLTSADARL